MDLSCPVCLEPFNEQARRPKQLPCGHTLCLACVQGIHDRQCPECRQVWAPTALVDNILALRLLNAADNAPPALWCSNCLAPSSARCQAEHDVRNPRVLLRQCLGDVVPQAQQQLDGLGDGLQDGGALTALRLLRGAPATCKLSLRQDDGEALGAELRVGEEPLLQALVAALAARGRLLPEPAAPAPEPAAPAPEPAPTCPGRKDVTIREILRSKALSARTRRAAPAPGPAAPEPERAVPQRIDELNVCALTGSGPGERQEEKAAALAGVRRQGVRRMVRVFCSKDPAWALDLLRSAAPTLQELEVIFPREEHLRAVHAMPRLQRLELRCSDGARDAQPPVLAALPQASLRWLRVEGLPRPTLVSLLQAHSATLDVLWLAVGTPGGRRFPVNCHDPDALLGQCGLRVTRVVLRRDWRHNPAACPAQVAAVRRVLPGATVQCKECDGVAFEDF